MVASLPEFPEHHRGRLPFWKNRSKYMHTSRSIDSAFRFPWDLSGPEFQHDPLPYSVERDEHRTLAAHEGSDGEIEFFSHPPHAMSSDHLFESYLRKSCYYLSNKTSPQVPTVELAKPPPTVDVFEYIREADQPEDALCKRCCMINIENLSEEGGYTHSMLDVLERSARSCRLCRTFCDSFESCQWSPGWTPDRYKMTLSLALEFGRQKITYPDHFNLRSNWWKCIKIGVVDTRPWQSRQQGTKRWRKKKKSGTESDSDEPQLQESSVFGISIMCYTEEGDPAMYAGLPWLRKNVGYTGSPGSLNVASGWLKKCLADETSGTNTSTALRHRFLDDDEDHDLDSSTSFPAERPTRLLEVLPIEDPDHPYNHSVKLIETNDRDYTYVALSYCWGEITDTTWLTKQGTIQRHMQNVDLGVLPATIRDCLHIAAVLGVHHVWVDSLCIIQDSASDWERESAKMRGIYRGATLTVAASKSTSSAEGCYNRNKRSSPLDPFAEYTCVESRLRDGQTSRLYFEKWVSSSNYIREGLFGSEVDGSPLSRRAWAYQEQVLSRRTLYFAESQLYWECDHCRLSQDNSQQVQGTRAYPVLTFSAPLNTEEIEELWYRGAVETYSKRGLTHASDKLVAISAVAKATYLNRHVSYVAGLWQDCILPGLCWHRDGRGRKNTAYTCPSWSWASQRSGVTYSMLPRERSHFLFKEDSDEVDPNLVKVLDAQVVPSEKNPFGHVRSGYIRLLTRVTTGTVMRDLFRPSYDTSGIYMFAGHGREHDTEALIISEGSGRLVWKGIAVLDDEGNRSRKVVIALIHERDAEYSMWLMLLLEQVGERENTYKRVGLGVVEVDSFYSKNKPNFERDWTEQVITIV